MTQQIITVEGARAYHEQAARQIKRLNIVKKVCGLAGLFSLGVMITCAVTSDYDDERIMDARFMAGVIGLGCGAIGCASAHYAEKDARRNQEKADNILHIDTLPDKKPCDKTSVATYDVLKYDEQLSEDIRSFQNDKKRWGKLGLGFFAALGALLLINNYWQHENMPFLILKYGLISSMGVSAWTFTEHFKRQTQKDQVRWQNLFPRVSFMRED